MLDYNLPENSITNYEQVRLKKLEEFEILDTTPEISFDTIAILAAEIFNVPYAEIAFIKSETIFFKSIIGNIERNTLRAENLCDLVINKKDVSVLENAVNVFNLKFYAGAPLITEDGYAIGSISVSDTVSHEPSMQQLNMLKHLASIVMEKLISRTSIRKAFKAHDDRLHMLVHDLKNPMTTVSLQSELIGRIPGVEEKIVTIAGRINAQSKNIVEKLNYILSSAKRINGSFKAQKEKLNLLEIFEEIEADLRFSADKKTQTIHLEIDNSFELYADRQKIIEIFKQIISNAVNFSNYGNEIKIMAKVAENSLIISVEDNGVGIEDEDIENIFTKFAVLKSYPTNKENSNRLGLSTAKMLVDLHKGKIWAESKGRNLGSTFFVELPIK